MENITQVELIENLLKTGNYLKMHRINYNGQRMYVMDNPFMYFSGLTSALSAATFKGNMDDKRLKGWRENMIDSFGKKNADDFLQMTADFGTLLHASLVTIKEQGGIKWVEEKDKAMNYFVLAYKEKNLEPDGKVIKSMSFEYLKHVSSLMQFIYERVSEIYAIETMCKSDTLKIATPVDMVCSCRQTEKGDFARTTINLKTSSSINNHQYEQISMENLMWNNTYPGRFCEYTAILRTKDWTIGKPPTYEYKYLKPEQSKDYIDYALPRLEICLNSKDSYYPNPLNKDFDGETKLGEIPVIVTKTLQEEWEQIKP